VTVTVVTGNVAVADPASTVTDAGIDPSAAVPAVAASNTTVSAVAAWPSVTFPAALPPAYTDDGVNVTEEGQFGVTLRFAVRVTPFWVAASCTAVAAATGTVPSENSAEVDPAGTVADGVADKAFEPVFTAIGMSRSMVVGASRVTLQVVVAPPTTTDGEHESAYTAGAATVSV